MTGGDMRNMFGNDISRISYHVTFCSSFGNPFFLEVVPLSLGTFPDWFSLVAGEVPEWLVRRLSHFSWLGSLGVVTPYSRSCPNLDATRRVHYDEVCSICKEIQATIKKH